MERNDIQKISSETANIPVYKQSAEYAIEHDELPAYRESFRVNMAELSSSQVYGQRV